jgi:hypothetical protein
MHTPRQRGESCETSCSRFSLSVADNHKEASRDRPGLQEKTAHEGQPAQLAQSAHRPDLSPSRLPLGVANRSAARRSAIALRCSPTACATLIAKSVQLQLASPRRLCTRQTKTGHRLVGASSLTMSTRQPMASGTSVCRLAGHSTETAAVRPICRSSTSRTATARFRLAS